MLCTVLCNLLIVVLTCLRAFVCSSSAYSVNNSFYDRLDLQFLRTHEPDQFSALPKKSEPKAGLV